MAATVRSASGGKGDGVSSVTLDKPAGTAEGDLLVLTQIADSDAVVADMTPPSGFTQDGSTQDGDTAGFRKTWLKTAGSSEPTSYDVGTSSSSSVVLLLACVTGQDATTPVNATAQDTGGNTADLVAPSVTTTVDGCLLLWFVGGARDGGGVTFTVTGGTIEEQQATGFEVGALASGTAGTAGATGTKTITGSAATNRGYLSFTMAIAPATGGGGTTIDGTVSAPLGGLSSAATGHRTVHGTVTAGLGGLSSSASSRRTVHGVIASPLGPVDTAVDGHRGVHGSATAGIGGLTTVADSVRTVHGVVTAPLGGQSTVIHGDVLSVVDGVVTAPLGGLQATATGHRTVHGTVAAALGGLDTEVVIGAAHRHGTVSAPLGQLTTGATGRRTVHGRLSAPLGRLLVTAGTHRSVHGHLVADLGQLVTTVALPTTPTIGYPDIESVLVAWLHGQYPSARVCTELPAKLADVIPVIQVDRIGGVDLQLVVDKPNVDVDVFGADRESARTLALDVWNRLRFTLPGTTTSGALISKVKTISGPKWVPYDNTNVRKFSLTVQLFSRNA